MFMDLPTPDCNGNLGSDAQITDSGILIVHGSYNRTIRNLSRAIWGDEICQYCLKPIKKHRLTIEHIYGREFGGVDITNCLTIVCPKCNADKDDLTIEQYVKLLDMIKNGEPKKNCLKFRATCRQENLNTVLSEKRFLLPDNWVDYNFPVKEIQINGVFNPKEAVKTKNYKKVKRVYNQRGMFKNPLIVDRRGFLIDGTASYTFARKNGLLEVPVILLDNVEIQRKK